MRWTAALLLLSAGLLAAVPQRVAASAVVVWEYRIRYGGSYGMLQARPSTSSTWGTVCDDDFSHHDAEVACRALGYDDLSRVSFRTVRSSEMTSSSDPIYFDDLMCLGNESRLHDCPHTPSARHNCEHSEDIMLACQTTPYPLSDSYTLRGGDGTWGRLEVNGRPVCRDNFGMSDARVACRSLRLDTSAVAFRDAGRGECGTVSGGYDDVQCSGDEEELSLCPRGSFNNCTRSEDIMLACGRTSVPSAISWTYRLTGGTSANDGRLEVRPSVNESWGYVCASGFDMNDAAVACRSLGLDSTTVSFRRTYSYGELGASRAWLDDPRCGGSEANLAACQQSTNTCPSCSVTAAVQLACGNASVPNQWEYRLADGGYKFGRLEGRETPSRPWGTICDRFSAFGASDAAVACRSLGYSTTNASFVKAGVGLGASSSLPHVMGGVGCGGTEASLADCSHDAKNYYSSSDACSGQPHDGNDIILACDGVTIPDRWEYRLRDGGYAYGRLEVRPANYTMWGGVCDDTAFTMNDAVTACRSLGLNSTVVAFASGRSGENDTAQLWMSDLGCGGSDTTLSQCNPPTYPSCSFTRSQVWLACGMTTVPRPYEYRLTLGGSTYGRLEVRPNNLSAWGAVCQPAFGTNDARVACRSLNLNTTTVSFRTASLGETVSTTASWMSSLSCGGSESELKDCGFSPLTACSVTTHIWLSCDQPLVPYGFEYRLAGGAADYGRLEARPTPYAAWGNVCDDSFGQQDTVVACRSLGLTTSTVSWRKVSPGEYATFSQPTWLDDLSCGGSESDLHSCARTSFPNCSPFESVMVGCGRQSIPIDTPQYRLVGSPSWSYGRVEVRAGENGTWSALCNNGFPGAEAAGQLCKALGLSASPVAFRAARGGEEANSSVLLSQITTCTPTSTSPCSLTDTTCSSHTGNDVILGCGVSTVPSLWSYTIGLGVVTTSSAYGLLYARSAPWDEWGVVCDSGFTTANADVACRGLGFATGNSSWRRIGFFGVTNSPVMHGVNCNGSEATLDQCPRSTSAATCAATDYVLLYCGTTPASSNTVPSILSYRLVGGNSSHGRLEASVVNANSWESVCDPHFDNITAQLACSRLGYSGTAMYRWATPGERGNMHQPTSPLVGARCTSDKGSPDMCDRYASAPAMCSHDTDVILSCGLSNTPSVWQHRLVGFDGTFGRLEVRPNPNSLWGTVCDDSFGYSETYTACRAMGLENSTVFYRTVRSDGTESAAASVPIMLDDLSCSGSGSSLGGCSTAQFVDCDHSEDVFVGCGYDREPQRTTWEYRLTNGGDHYGRLETRPNTTAPWGTVCHSEFKTMEARVACATLGFPTLRYIARPAEYGEAAGPEVPVYVTNMSCAGSESSLSRCSFNYNDPAAASRGCDHTRDVFLSCGTNTIPSSWEYRLEGGTNTFGRLEARPNPNFPWGFVCSKLFQAVDARVACSSLRLSNSEFAFRPVGPGEYGSPSQTAAMLGLGCSGSEQQLSDCSRDRSFDSTCSHESAVMVACGTSTVPSLWQYRLSGGSAPTFGRLEVRPDGNSPWGSVCNTGFDAADARVMCRALGQNSLVASFRTALPNELPANSAQTATISDLQCTGLERSVAGCTFTSPAPTASCGARSTDVILSCGTTSVPSLWQYRLKANSASMSSSMMATTVGRLEVRGNGDLPWGTVCDDGFTQASATVACRSMGLPTTAVSFRTAIPTETGLSSQPVTFSEVSCAGSERELSSCPRAANTSMCGFSEAIVLSCGAATVEQTSVWQYRVVGGSPSTGRLEVRETFNGTWGTVCSDGFNGAAALAACRSLGYFSTRVAHRTAMSSAEEGAAMQPVAIASISCPADATTLQLCTVQTAPACPHSRDVLVACNNASSVPRIAGTTVDARSTWEYRLMAGSAHRGRLEVRPDRNTAWGTVCGSGFDMQAAQVACDALGFSGAVSFSSTVAPPTMTVYMDELMCGGEEARLEYCPYLAQHNCRYWDSVMLECSPSAKPAPAMTVTTTPWGYRLARGEAFNDGWLETMRPGAGWSAVCADNFTKADAVVACRALGLSTSVMYWWNGTAAAPPALNGLLCSGAEARPELCPLSVWPSLAGCRAVRLLCGPRKAMLSTTIRLSGTGWATVLANPQRRLVLWNDVRADIADLLGISPSAVVKIRRLSLGSLVVDFDVTAANPSRADALGNVINATLDRNASASLFSRTQAIYAADTTEGQAGEVINVSSAAAVVDASVRPTAPPARGGPPSPEEEGECDVGTTCFYIVIFVMLVVIIIGVVLVLKLVVFAPKTGEAAKPAPMAPPTDSPPATTNEPYTSPDPSVWADPAGPPPAKRPAPL